MKRLVRDIADANITAAKLSGAQTGSAPIYGCRAWVNFDGTGTIGTNMTIRGSGNVSSVYKNGTGDYTITFTTAMPDANYASVSTPYDYAAVSRITSASSFKILTFNTTSGAARDDSDVKVAIFR